LNIFGHLANKTLGPPPQRSRNFHTETSWWKMARSEPEEEFNRICRVCYTNEANSCLVPCGHLCMCYECATSAEFMQSVYSKMQCPMCRAPIRTVYKTFRVPIPLDAAVVSIAANVEPNNNSPIVQQDL
jgi:hypothetical protein